MKSVCKDCGCVFDSYNYAGVYTVNDRCIDCFELWLDSPTLFMGLV